MLADQFQINQYKALKITFASCVVPLAAIIALSILSFSIINQNTSDDVSALSETTNVAVDNQSYYASLATSGGSVNIDVQPTVDGVYASTVDHLTVSTNNPTGYNLYISTDGDNSNLYLNGDSNNRYIPGTTGTYYDPRPLRDNTYGYAVPSTTTGTINNRFNDSYTTPNPTPDSIWASLADNSTYDHIQQTSAANTSGQSIDVYYGIHANNALASGTYIGGVTYTVMPREYVATGGATISPTIGEAGSVVDLAITTDIHTLSTDFGTIIVTLANNVNSYTCQNPTANVSTGTLIISCATPNTILTGTYTVTVEVPKYGKTYTITDGYFATPNSLKDHMFMQDVTTSICNNTKTWEQEARSYTLIDSRDGNTYQVRRLKDGNCWMVQNLRLNLSTSRTLTASDTDVASFTPENDTQTDSTAIAWTDDEYNSASSAINQARSYKTGSGLSNDTQANNRDYGNYYNYYAATAGTGNYSLVDGQNASGSICPKGWQLPPSAGDKSWYNLLFVSYALASNAAGVDAAQRLPFSITLSGNYNPKGIIYYQGSSTPVEARHDGHAGAYRTSTAKSNDDAYILDVVASPTVSLAPQSSLSKNFGFPIRCVSR